MEKRDKRSDTPVDNLQLLGSEAKKLTCDEILHHFSTSETEGLTSNSVERLLEDIGPNELQEEESETLLQKFLEQFNDPMIIMLFVSAVISVLLGQFSDALSIFLAIVIVCTVAFIQEYRSDQAISELQELVHHSCTVIRDGETKIIDTSGLVPGDVVLFERGDRIPADIRIVDISQPIRINESVFTGENRPRKKDVNVNRSPMKQVDMTSRRNFEESSDDYEREDSNELINRHYGDENVDESFSLPRGGSWADLSDENLKHRYRVYSNIVQCGNIGFMGTIVSTGKGKGVVISTGNKTELGRISLLLQSIKEVKTPLEKTMGKLAQTISYVSFAIIIVIFIIGVLSGKGYMEMFNMGISLAVAAIPEGLPVVVTVTLGMGVLRMARKNTIVRKLQSVETLGAVNVICSDKTGTLTENQMTVTELFLPSQPSKVIHVTGTGYTTGGSFYSCDINDWKDTYDLSKSSSQEQQFLPRSAVKIEKNPYLDRLCITGNICNDSEVDQDGSLVGLPTEGALVVLSQKRGLPDMREKVWARDESRSIPFSTERKWMRVFAEKVGNLPKRKKMEDADGGGDQIIEVYAEESEGEDDQKHDQRLFMKGALERVIDYCDRYLGEDEFGEINPVPFGLDSTTPQLHDKRVTKKFILQLASQLTQHRNLRVLGMAEGDPGRPKELFFLGFVGMVDPPRIGVHESIKKLRKSGIRVVMITGDSRDTALSIARSLSIITPEEMGGRDVALTASDVTSPQTFIHRVESARVFYRVEPIHKMAIVHALQKRGNVVGMTGDGVNDAPALKKADIGISMGKSGTDVCREASDMVLTDDNFSTIMTAIEEGKSIFNNIKHFLRFQLTTSVTAMGLIVFSTILDYPLPLNPMQILYVNLIMDGAPAQSLGLEPVDHSVMKQPPRKLTDNIISKKMITSILINSTVMMVGSLWVFLKEYFFDYVVDARDTSMVFCTFVMFQVFNAFNCRSADKSILEIGVFKNKPLLFACSLSVLGLVVLLYVPLLQSIFDTQPIGIMDWVLVLIVSSSVLFVEEFVKYLRRKGKGKDDDDVDFGES